MFGRGTFKSSGSFRPSVSATLTANRVLTNEKIISTFNEAENENEPVKSVQLYNKFINEADNSDEGT